MAKTKNKGSYDKAWFVLAVSRISLGFIFLWAFFDKWLGLGLSTAVTKSWISGVSPTTGFLNAAGKGTGPFADLFSFLASQSWVDWAFMLGLLGLGVALILGVGLRIAAVAGTLLMLLMWAATLPIKTNPFLDDHLIYALLMIIIAMSPRKISVFPMWLSIPSVKKNSWLW